jgi:hypothetical protein
MGFCLVLGLAGAVSGKLVAHWKLDETTGTMASDSSGNGYNGTLMGGATWAAGAIDGALEVNGSNGYVDFGNPSNWPDGRNARSLCAWARTDTVAAGWKWIAAYGSPATSQAMFIGLNGSALYGGGYGDDILVNNFWQTGVWHHLALIYDGSMARLYANGVEVISAPKAWNLVLSRAHLGRQVNNAAEFWDGAIDDVRIYDHALTLAEVKALIPPKLKARDPSPADGETGFLGQLLKWTAGDTAQWHNVYLGTSPELTEADLVSPLWQTAMYWHIPGFESGVTYSWRIDEVEADGTTVYTGDVWTFTAAPVKAFNASPAAGARFQDLDVTLSWTAGTLARSHDVYFGTDQAAVSAGAADTFKGNQFLTTYTPAGLVAGTTYFWRIDEVRGGGVKQTGDVWSFSTLPDIAVSDPDLVGWWTLDEQEGARAIDWSGHGVHGSFIGNVKWMEGMVGGGLEFDGDGDYVDLGSPEGWPVGAEPRSMCAWAKTDSISAGWKWIAAYGSPGGGQAMFIGLTGTSLYGGGYADDVFIDNFWEPDVWHHIALTYDGTIARLYADGIEVASGAKTWNLVRGRAHIGRQVNTLVEFWDGAIDDVRIYKIALTPEQIREAMRGDPRIAWNPQPATGANVDIRDATELNWSAGDGAAQHDVYLGKDKDAVKVADAASPLYLGRQSGTSFSLDEQVEFGGGPYFWRIDEIEADGATVHKGLVWGFTVPDYLIIDEFEGYTDEQGNRIYESWIDGLTDGKSGSTVGNMVAPFAERTMIHGGKQSMPLDYNNVASPFFSEAQREFSPVQNWTAYGVGSLSLWFRGNPVAYLETGPGAFTMSAAGNDIWNTVDEFRLAYRRLNGDGSIVARVDSLMPTDGWAKAGVMIRESLNAGSKHAAVVVTPSNGVSFPYRAFTGDVSNQVNLAGVVAPYWVRLTRTGDVFKAEHSANGTTWTVLGTEQTISMVGTIYIGLCLTSHSPAVATVAEYSEVTATGATGSWQVAEIGVDHPGNSQDDLYVAIEDSAGKSATIIHPDPAAVLATAWTEWTIPLSSLTGVNLSKVKRMYIGVGDRKSSPQDGAGRIYIDDIRLTQP